jgi:hypothetical protein
MFMGVTLHFGPGTEVLHDYRNVEAIENRDLAFGDGTPIKWHSLPLEAANEELCAGPAPFMEVSFRPTIVLLPGTSTLCLFSGY